MGYFFDQFPFPDQSRMTGISHFTPAGARRTDAVALGQFIHLPEGQDGHTESNFLGPHLPFRSGGFHGAYPDGNSWLVVLQHAPADAGDRLGLVDPFHAMRDAMTRALGFNPGAIVTFEIPWTTADLIEVYEEYEVSSSAVGEWSIHDLLTGLLAQCCRVPLDQIANGRAEGCAFPGVQHACEADVFDDVFVRWSARNLT